MWLLLLHGFRLLSQVGHAVIRVAAMLMMAVVQLCVGMAWRVRDMVSWFQFKLRLVLTMRPGQAGERVPLCCAGSRHQNQMLTHSSRLTYVRVLRLWMTYALHTHAVDVFEAVNYF